MFDKEKHRCWQIIYCAVSPNPYIRNLGGVVTRGFYGITKRRDGYYQHLIVVQMPSAITAEHVVPYVSRNIGEELYEWMALPIRNFDTYLEYARFKGWVDGEF